MKTKETKLAKLKKQQVQLKARIQVLEASEKSRERKRETRRKILIGAYYLDKVRQENRWEEIATKMDGYLKRDSDRALFELASLTKAAGTGKTADQKSAVVDTSTDQTKIGVE